MAQSLTKTAIIFGVIIFYISTIFFIGIIDISGINTGIHTTNSTDIGWSINKVTANISELGWLNILLFIPIGLLLAFMFLTSSIVYNIE